MKAIMYHYVRNSDKNFPYFRYLSVENFAKQLDYLSEKFGLICFDEFMELSQNLKSFEKLKNKVLLTFDDGFLDHYQYVLPELKKRNTFGIFFIPTGVYQNQKALDVHRIHYLLGKVGGGQLMNRISKLLDNSMLELDKIEEFNQKTYTKQDNDSATQEFKKIFNYYIKYEFREKILDEIVKQFGSDEQIFKNLYMSKKQLQEMHNNQMLLGSHSVGHFVFSKLNEQEQMSEISQSFDFLEKTLGELYIRVFCYPYGGFHTFTDFTERYLSEFGCKFSFNVESKDINLEHLSSRPQALPRYDCNEFEFGKANLG